MTFNEYIEIDTSSNSILVKTYKEKNNEIILKLNEKEVEEIKFKQDAIELFSSNKDFSNPLSPEFIINVYFHNYKISIEVVGENKEDIEKFYEYLKSILI